MSEFGRRVCLLFGFALLVFCGLLTALHTVGTDAALYERLQLEAGVLDTAGIDHAELRMLDRSMAAYLRGDATLLAVPARGGGEGSPITPLFNEREMTHMEDCMRLFVLLRRAMLGTLIFGVGLVALGLALRARPAEVRLMAWLAPLIVLIPLAAFAVWAVADFNAAFTFFHHVLFTNDLWLLDPRTDLLIRICPASMFMNMGLRIAAAGLACAVGLPAAVSALILLKEKLLK